MSASDDNLKTAYRMMIDQAFNRYIEKVYEGNKSYAEISRVSNLILGKSCLTASVKASGRLD